MILPAKALLWALTAWLAAAIAAAFLPLLMPAVSGLGLLIALWAAADWLLVRRVQLPAMQRRVQQTLPLGIWSPVELLLHWPGWVPRQVELFDHSPAHFAQEGMPATVRGEASAHWSLRYRIRAYWRGDHDFAPLELRLRSPWHAWLRRERVGEAQAVKVYPNFAPLARHALHAVDYRNARFGQQQRRRRGQGMDFAQLREYREGDSQRQIDWKASTRLGKMISREYQDERDQRILLLLDCGRRMGARDAAPGQRGESLSHFDHALDALLLLAYVALRHGDRVGLMTLGGVDRHLPAQHSPATIGRILRETYDLQPGLAVSDFERAAQQLLLRERKRALVILLTNLRDEDDANLIAATRLLRERHLVLVASLREAVLDSAQHAPISSPHDAARVAAAADYASRRAAALRRLRAEGVLCLDVAPEQLAVASINRYLEIKAAHQL